MESRNVGWVLSAVAIAAFYILYHRHKNKAPGIDVLDAVYNRDANRIQLILRNDETMPQYIKSAVRLVYFVPQSEEYDADGVPMLSGSAHSTVAEYDLLVEDQHPVVLNPSSVEKVTYFLGDDVPLRANDYVRVDVSCRGKVFGKTIPVTVEDGVGDLLNKVDADIMDLISYIDDRLEDLEVAGEGKKAIVETEEKILESREEINSAVSAYINQPRRIGLSIRGLA